MNEVLFTPAARSAALREFLSARGVDIELVKGAIDTSFGEPELSVVTGSVTVGFGTPHSDLDLCTVVPSTDVTLLPLTVHEAGVRIDLRFLSGERLRSDERSIRQGWPPPPGEMSASVLQARYVMMETLVRLSLGVEIQAAASDAGRAWQTWLQNLEGGWLLDRVVEILWWEAFRLRQASRWLVADSPVAAAYQLALASTFAFEAVAADAGDIYWGFKWLPRKLVRLGRHDLLDALAGISQISTEDRAEQLVDQADPLVSEELDLLAAKHGIDASTAAMVLRPAPGVEIFDAYGRQIVTRWHLSGIEFRPAPFDTDAVRAGSPFWEGRPCDPLPDWARTLLVESMASVLVGRGMS